jgi:signal peptidase II
MMKPTYKLAALTALLAFAADQASKYALLQKVDFGTAREVVVTPFFSLVKWWNEGVSFGVFNGSSGSTLQRWLLTALTLAIIGGLLRWLASTTRPLPAIAIGGIIGGALGNLLDRFHYGAVADFLYFHIAVGGRQYGYPAFNIGDSCIVVGVGLLLLDSFRKSSTGTKTVDEKA